MRKDEQVRNVIIGSGPAAAGAALALAGQCSGEIVVLDVGGTLDPEVEDVVSTMAAQRPQDWSSDHLALITKQPVSLTGQALPEKRTYGSAYPFADLGQAAGLLADTTANAAAVSGAYGGFSNVWGAQVMPFSKSTFSSWPVSWAEMAPHYAAVLSEIPLAAEEDDYGEGFPLMAPAMPLPPLAPRSVATLERYAAHRGTLRASGIVVGRARLAFDARRCVGAGLCMTGCPYGYIYSARHTMARFGRDANVKYYPGRLVLRVSEAEDAARVSFRDLKTGAIETLDADRVFIACGALGTTRLIAASLGLTRRVFEMAESAQFILPFVSAKSTGDPREQVGQFTLNQFNILVQFDDQYLTTSQVHCYPYNPAILAALPPLAATRLRALTGQALGRLTVGLGYLPSWCSPPVRVQLNSAQAGQLPEARIRARGENHVPLMLKAALSRLRRAGPALDLHPVSFAVRLAGPAKSYHFGGTFPHVAPARPKPAHGLLPSDRLGRVRPLTRVHLVDGSVLPTLPSTTFTLTVMANAHRIASEATSQGADCFVPERRATRGF